MALDLNQQAAARRARRTIAVLIAVVVVLAGAVLALFIADDDTGSSSAPNAPAVVPGGAGPAAVPGNPKPSGNAGSDVYTAPQRWITLPASAGQRNGFPTNYPHTPEGAVAAAVAATRNGWSWDPDAAARAALAYTLPADAADIEEAARQATGQSRAGMGVPPTGPLPAGAALNVWAVGVKWQPVGADRVDVSVSARLIVTTAPGGEATTLVVARTSVIVWDGSDWRTKNAPAGQQPQPFDVGQSGFNEAGWTAIREGDIR
ncbi:hypothetical protein OG948_33280 [Embleya sp. NBC_00888]|uniref:hypothetical protein n=1 Tax=Embleya sp. NBC_00888 TaxID=2975960 RepID=UPI0038688691|nr:hypothetical protein OG948_33280 [Embleya sp. NBC_00888]